MANYEVKVDLSNLFDEMSYNDQKEFVIEKFGEICSYMQEDTAIEILKSLPSKTIVSVIKDVFVGLNENEQAEVVEFANT